MDCFWSRVHVLGFLALSLLVTSGSCLFCRFCTCPALYNPVCGVRARNTFVGVIHNFQTFAQPCELFCQNNCIGPKFQLLHYGRCTVQRITINNEMLHIYD